MAHELEKGLRERAERFDTLFVEGLTRFEESIREGTQRGWGSSDLERRDRWHKAILDAFRAANTDATNFQVKLLELGDLTFKPPVVPK